MKSTAIDQFIRKNIQNFRLNGSGWNDLIEKMLFELCIAGWDINSEVGGKEKMGGLRCYIIHEDKVLESKAKKIVRKYAHLSEKTCEICGVAGRRRVDRETQWETILCRTCYLKSELEKQRSYPIAKDTTLSECSICGYIAVADDHCDFCNNDSYTSDNPIYKPSAYYNTELAYIKECQMQVFIDADNEIELSKKIRHFRKSETHQIVFSAEDLEQFIREQEEDQDIML